MDANPNSRYRSRVLREMAQSRQNPFNSPPSSTGSHGSVSPTVTSALSFGEPDGESTRRMEDDLSLPTRRRNHTSHKSSRFGPHSVNINTSAIERAFPGWYKPAADDADSTAHHSDSEADSTKENRPISRPKAHPKKTYTVGGRERTLPELQARVDNESTSSTVHSAVAKMASSGPLREIPRSVSAGQLPVPAPAVQKQSPFQPGALPKNPTVGSFQHQYQQQQQQQMMNTATMDNSMHTMNRTMGSFFLPNLSHVNDFVSGNLRFSDMQNGVPVFVRNGKVHDKVREGPSQHAEVDNIEIPQDEQDIFVSMDMIREEVCALQEHRDMLQREAEQLQDEVHTLQSEIERHRHTKRDDSALGSESDRPSSSSREEKHKLEEQLAALQSRLDHATRQISLTDIHHSSLSAERDQAVKELAAAYEKVKEFEVQLATARSELESITRLRSDVEILRTENKSLRTDNTALREDRESLTKENQSLRSTHRTLTQQHDSLGEDYATVQAELDQLHDAFQTIKKKHQKFEKSQLSIKEDNDELQKHNERFFQENQKLRHENVMYERKNNDLKEKSDRLQQLVELHEQETRTQTQTHNLDAIFELRKENGSLKTELERLKAELLSSKPRDPEASLKEHISRLNAEIETVRQQAQSAQKISCELEEQNARLRVEADALKLRSLRSSTGARAENVQLNTEFYEIQEKLALAEEEIELLRKEKLALSTKFDTLQARYSALSQDNDRAYRKLDQYQAQFLDMVKQVQHTVDESQKVVNPPTKQVTFADPPNTDREKAKMTITPSESTTATGKSSTARMEEDYEHQFQFVPTSERTKDMTVDSELVPRPVLRRSSRPEHTADKDTVESGFLPRSRYTSTAGDPTDTDVLQEPEQPTVDDEEFKSTMPSDLPPRPAMRPGHSRVDSHDHTMPSMSFDLSKGLPLPIAQWSGCVNNARGYAELNIGGDNATTENNNTQHTVDTDKSCAIEDSDVEDIESEESADEDVERHGPATMDLTIEENMTSAFFMPDITIDNPKNGVKSTRKASAKIDDITKDVIESIERDHLTTKETTRTIRRTTEDSRRIVIDGRCNHDGANCTLCARSCDHATAAKDGKAVVRVFRPVPISERILDYDEDPTMRPSRDPGEALAIVIKSLEDEAEHLKKIIQATRERYDTVDPAVNRRGRKAVSKELHRQMRVLEGKQDQIYALYDVLEGQRRVGQGMSVEELDVTVRSIVGFGLGGEVVV